MNIGRENQGGRHHVAGTKRRMWKGEGQSTVLFRPRKYKGKNKWRSVAISGRRLGDESPFVLNSATRLCAYVCTPHGVRLAR